MLQLADHWVWDSWVADDGERYHLFFLKAPRALGDPSTRHLSAAIGHATSTGLVEWTELPDALSPCASGWDDRSLWTGSVVAGNDGVWRLYYTALNSGPHAHFDQRIGLAESADLVTWRRVGDAPVVAPDPCWYRTLGGDWGPSETWRDPFVFRDPGGDGWHMLITARITRAAGAATHDDGVLAHARSADGRCWELGPPLSEPGTGFGQLEVSQVRVVDGQPLLVFTCHPAEQTEARRRTCGLHSTWSVAADSVLGPWDVAAAEPFRDEPLLFAAPLVQARDGGWVLLGFRNLEPDGVPALHIVDPIPVRREGAALVRR